MKLGMIKEIHTIEAAIDALEELYINISAQKNLFINKEQDIASNTKYKNLTKEILEEKTLWKRITSKQKVYWIFRKL